MSVLRYIGGLVIAVLLAFASSASQVQVDADAGVFNRADESGFSPTTEIAFAFPQRPTINVSLGDQAEIPMLLDSGTSRLIFMTGQGCQLPSGLTLLENMQSAAAADGKLEEFTSGRVEYATAPLVNIGGFRQRNVTLRVYREGQGTADRDFCGAIPLNYFAGQIVELDNPGKMIRLHPRESWLPPPDTLVLPLLQLPQGSFIPASMEHQDVWLLVDTGFSGTLAVPAKDLEDFSQTAEPPLADFLTWRGGVSLTQAVVSRLEFAPTGRWPFEMENSLILKDIDSYRLSGTGPVLPYGLAFGGIIGAGLLSRFNYAFDLTLGRFYLWQPQGD